MKGTITKILSCRGWMPLMILVCLLSGSGQVWGQAPTWTHKTYTSGQKYYLYNVGTKRYLKDDNTTTTDPDAAIVWTVTTSSGNTTIKSNAGKYVSMTATSSLKWYTIKVVSDGSSCNLTAAEYNNSAYTFSRSLNEGWSGAGTRYFKDNNGKLTYENTVTNNSSWILVSNADYEAAKPTYYFKVEAQLSASSTGLGSVSVQLGTKAVDGSNPGVATDSEKVDKFATVSASREVTYRAALNPRTQFLGWFTSEDAVTPESEEPEYTTTLVSTDRTAPAEAQKLLIAKIVEKTNPEVELYDATNQLVNNTKFTAGKGFWSDAVTHANSNAGCTIKLIDDVAGLGGALSITKNTTIDLNGHTLTGDPRKTSNTSMIYVNTTGVIITIKDSQTGGKIKMSSTHTAELQGLYVEKGKLVLESGTIDAENLSASAGAVGVKVLANGTFEQKGGTILANGGANTYGIHSVGQLLINDGTVEGATGTGANAYAVYSKHAGLIINGGTFNADSKTTTAVALHTQGADCYINAGNFTAHAGTTTATGINIAQGPVQLMDNVRAIAIAEHNTARGMNIASSFVAVQGGFYSGEGKSLERDALASPSVGNSYGFGIRIEGATSVVGINGATIEAKASNVNYSQDCRGIYLAAGQLYVRNTKITSTSNLQNAYGIFTASGSVCTLYEGNDVLAKSLKLATARGVHNEGKLTVLGGTYKAETTTTNAYGIYIKGNSATNTTSIEGGIFSGVATTNTAAGAYLDHASSIVDITGGSFTSEAKGTNLSAEGNLNAYGIMVNAASQLSISGDAQVLAKATRATYGRYAYGLYIKPTTTDVTINGNVSIAGQSALSYSYGIYNLSGKLTINGGAFAATSTTDFAYGLYNGSTGHVEVADGKFKSKVGSGYANFADFYNGSSAQDIHSALYGGYYQHRDQIDMNCPQGHAAVALETTEPEYADGYRYKIHDELFSSYVCMIGAKGFTSLAAALEYANQHADDTQTILMKMQHTLPVGKYTIPAKTTLLVPYHEGQTAAIGESLGSSYRTDDRTLPSQFLQLTLASGVEIDVLGTIEASAEQYCYTTAAGTGIVNGQYGQIELEEGSKLTFASGAKLNAWGFITGKGEIDVRRGAVVHEMFQITTWKGGTVLTVSDGGSIWDGAGMLGNGQKVFPINQYYIQNIEAPTTYHPGSRLTTSTGTTVSGAIISVDDIGIVGIKNKLNGEANDIAMFLMDDHDDSDDTWVKKEYNPIKDSLEFTVNSAASLSSIKINLSGNSMDSKDYDLPIANNIKITLLNGMMDITQNIVMLPGAEMEVMKEATLQINAGCNAYLYDNDEWDIYAMNQYIYPIPYSPSWARCPRIGEASKVEKTNASNVKYSIGNSKLTDAALFIHGTLLVNGGLMSTTGGAKIYSTDADAGTVIFSSAVGASPNKSVYQWNSNKYYEAALQYSPLLNADETFTETKNAPANASFCYTNGKWERWEDLGCIAADMTDPESPVYYAKPAEYVAIDSDEEDDQHLYHSVEGGKTLILVSNTDAYCQWWEVEVVGENLVYCEKTGLYYEYVEDKYSWMEKRFVVTWCNYDGTVLPLAYNNLVDGTKTAKFNTKYGSTPVYNSTAPTRAASATAYYTFIGWNTNQAATEALDVLPVVTANTTFYAIYKEEHTKFDVTYKLDNDKILEIRRMDAGTDPTYVGTPVKSATSTHTYTFTNWAPAFATVTEDAVYVANFAENEISYMVTWKVNATTTSETVVGGNQVVNIPAVEKITTTAQKETTFVGWKSSVDGMVYTNEEIPAVTKDVTYTAMFREEIRKYAITWKGPNDYTIKTERLTYGARPAVDNVDYDFNGYSYTFNNKWIAEDHTEYTPSTLPIVTKDAVYVGAFTKSPITYQVKFDGNGATSGSMSNQSFTYDEQKSLSANAYTKNGHNMLGWATTNVATTAEYQDKAEVTNLTDTKDAVVTLYAVWEKKASTWDDKIINTSETVADDTDVNANSVTITDNGSLEIAEGASLTTSDLILEATTNTSGQLIQNGTINVTGNAHFDLTLNAQKRTWYAIAMPWRVDAENGIYIKGGRKLELGRDFDIIYYNGDSRATSGASADNWNYVEDDGDKTLIPGRAYMIYFAAEQSTIRFVKKDGALVFSGTVSTPTHTGTADDTNWNWNGIANPTLYHATLDPHVTHGQVYKNGELFSENDGYKTVSMSEVKFIVGKPVFVQSGSSESVVIARAGSQTAASPVRVAANPTIEYEVRLNNAQGQETDNLFVQVEDDKDDTYVIGKDLVKAGVSSKCAQMWVNRYNSKLCVNTMAEADQITYPLVMNTPQTGEYTIEQVHGASDYTLYLTQDGVIIWDLSMSEYSLTLTAGTNASYGLLLVRAQQPGVTTGINETEVHANVQKIIFENQLYIISDGHVYNAQGKLVK